jgi:hypothetical protein
LDFLKVLHVASQIEKLEENRSGWKSGCGVWHGGKDDIWSGRSLKFMEVLEKCEVRYTISY